MRPHAPSLAVLLGSASLAHVSNTYPEKHDCVTHSLEPRPRHLADDKRSRPAQTWPMAFSASLAALDLAAAVVVARLSPKRSGKPSRLEPAAPMPVVR